MATELDSRGFELRAPLFAARALLDAPALVEAVHRDYLDAGAQVLTTNSFGLHLDSLAAAGLAARRIELLQRSVELAQAVRRPGVRIAGSIPPRPRPAAKATPSQASDAMVGRAEYHSYARALLDAGADLIVLETFTALAEVRLALEGLADVDQPVWLSVAAGAPVPGSPRPDGTRLVHGDELRALSELIAPDPGSSSRGDLRVPDAVQINCTQIDAVPAALDQLIELGTQPLGLSPHLGKRRYDGAWIDHFLEPEVFAEQIHAWMHTRPRLVFAGACCGSHPTDIAAMKRWLQPDTDAREQAFMRLDQLVPRA